MSNNSNPLPGFSDMKWEQAHALLHVLFEMLPDGVVLIAPQSDAYIIADCNSAYARMNGYTVDELIGSRASSLLGDDSYAASVTVPDSNFPFHDANLPFLEIVRGAGVLHSRITHRRKDGSLFPVEFSARLVSVGKREFILGLDRDVTAQTNFEKIQKSEDAMRAIFDSSPLGIVVLDVTRHPHLIYDCNFAFCRMNGYARDELLGQPITILDCTEEEARAVGLDVRQDTSNVAINDFSVLTVGQTFFGPTAWHKRKDGEIIAIEYSSKVVLINGEKRLLGIDRDITQRRREERLDFDRNRVLELIATGANIEQSLSGLETLVEGQLVSVSCAFLLLATPINNAFAPACGVDGHAPADNSTLRPVWRVAAEHRHDEFKNVAFEESALLRRATQPHTMSRPLYFERNPDTNRWHNGEYFSQDVVLTALRNANRCWLQPVLSSAGVLGVVVLASGSSHTSPPVDGEKNERLKNEIEFEQRFDNVLKIALRIAAIAIEQHSMGQRLAFQAENDLLTGLPNRYLFEDRLSHALKQIERRKTRLALLFLDLDGFKTVNDTWGHQSGDCILQEVASRIKNCVRASDTVARLGGDEFTLILSDTQNNDDARKVAKKIVVELNRPFYVGEHQVQLTASIGIAFAPDDGDTIQKLMRNADSAMYCAKESGKNRHEFY